MDEKVIRTVKLGDDSCGTVTDNPDDCECPANLFFQNYGDKLKEHADRLLLRGSKYDDGDYEGYEEQDMDPNYVIEIIKEGTVTDVHEKSKLLIDHQKGTMSDVRSIKTDKSGDITQSLIELCKDLLEPKQEDSHDFLKFLFEDIVENAMEYSENRIDTCSCLLRDSDAYICGTYKDDAEKVCVAILIGQKSTCSTSSDEVKKLDQASQDVVCTCRICVCGADEEEGETGMEESGQFEDFEEEEQTAGIEICAEEEEFRTTEEEWKSKSMKLAEEYLKKHKIQELFNFMNASLLAHNPENPVQYLINLLDRCLLYRQDQIGPPLIFSARHIESLYKSMDPMNFGRINLVQYKTGMFTLGLKYYNPFPMLDDNGLVTKEIFIREALECMQLCFDEMIRIRKTETRIKKNLISSSTLSSDTCRCNVSLIS